MHRAACRPRHSSRCVPPQHPQSWLHHPAPRLSTPFPLTLPPPPPFAPPQAFRIEHPGLLEALTGADVRPASAARLLGFLEAELPPALTDVAPGGDCVLVALAPGLLPLLGELPLLVELPLVGELPGGVGLAVGLASTPGFPAGLLFWRALTPLGPACLVYPRCLPALTPVLLRPLGPLPCRAPRRLLRGLPGRRRPAAVRRHRQGAAVPAGPPALRRARLCRGLRCGGHPLQAGAQGGLRLGRSGAPGGEPRAEGWERGGACQVAGDAAPAAALPPRLASPPAFQARQRSRPASTDAQASRLPPLSRTCSTVRVDQPAALPLPPILPPPPHPNHWQDVVELETACSRSSPWLWLTPYFGHRYACIVDGFISAGWRSGEVRRVPWGVVAAAGGTVHGLAPRRPAPRARNPLAHTTPLPLVPPPPPPRARSWRCSSPRRTARSWGAAATRRSPPSLSASCTRRSPTR